MDIEISVVTGNFVLTRHDHCYTLIADIETPRPLHAVGGQLCALNGGLK